MAVETDTDSSCDFRSRSMITTVSAWHVTTIVHRAYFVVVLDLKDEMINHAFRHRDLTIDQKAKGNEVRIPVVQL